MEWLIFACRLLLAAVMGVAGIAKLADLPGSRQAMIGFGLPARLAPAAGLLLPILEISVALLLLITGTAWVGAWLALLLLLAFIGGISMNLARGQRPQCHCFGQLHSEAIGRPTLARNAALAAVALWLVWQGPQRMAGGATLFAGTQTVTWMAFALALLALGFAALEGWFLLNLLQQNGRLLLRLEALEAKVGLVPTSPAPSVSGLAVGSAAPAFSLAGFHGETLTLDSLRALHKPIMLFFLDAQCGPCHALLPEIAGWQREHGAKLTLAPITQGKFDAARMAEYGLQYLLVDHDSSISTAYKVVVTPSAILVQPDGTVGSAVAQGTDAIRALVANATGAQRSPFPAARPQVNDNGSHKAHAHSDCNCGKNSANGHNSHNAIPAGAQRGDMAPSFELPDLSGSPVTHESLQGQSTLLLFWNPGCGYCRKMLDGLKAWEQERPENAPRLLLISTGTVEANQSLALHSTILLDSGFTVGRSFGARGTPSAVLVDAEGRIASGVAVGGEAVLRLAQGELQPQLQQKAVE